MIDYNQREVAFSAASNIQQNLYSSREAGKKISNIAKLHSKTITDYPAFSIAVGDVILGLVPQEKLPELLIERLKVSQADAMRITADVLDFLEPLKESNATLVPISSDTQPVETTTVPNNDQDTLAAELAATEAAFKQLQPIRTMAHDMETIRTDDEPVHQAASQESILNGQGNASKNTQAEWGTPEK